MGVIQEDLCSLCGQEKESLEHLFISCEKHLDARALVEHLIQKYTNDCTFTLSDKTRILGTGVKNSLCLLLIGKLHRVIWRTRCFYSDRNNKSQINILKIYRHDLRKHIINGRKRLDIDKFCLIYCKRKCSLFFGE